MNQALNDYYKSQIALKLAKAHNRAEIIAEVNRHLNYKFKHLTNESIKTFWPDMFRYVLNLLPAEEIIDIPKRLTNFKEFDPFADNDLTYLLDEII
jgi:hypothetical protein